MASGRKASSAAVAVVLVSLLIVAAATTVGALTLCGVDGSAVDACRSFCQVGSTEGSPSQLCCNKLKKAQFSCLCKYQSYLPSDIDANRVMMIPAKCNMNAPPNLCN